MSFLNACPLVSVLNIPNHLTGFDKILYMEYTQKVAGQILFQSVLVHYFTLSSNQTL